MIVKLDDGGYFTTQTVSYTIQPEMVQKAIGFGMIPTKETDGMSDKLRAIWHLRRLQRVTLPNGQTFSVGLKDAKEIIETFLEETS